MIDVNMIKIINCPMCGSEEYYGALIWPERICRKCARKKGIKDSEYEFPLYNDGEDYRPKNYYVSLVRSLFGYYLKFNAYSEEIVRRHLLEYYGKLWCSIYSEQEFKSSPYYTRAKVINEDAPIELYNHYDWE